MASTSNAENFLKIARIVYQLCDYTDFRADFLQTGICGKWLVFANQVTYTNCICTVHDTLKVKQVGPSAIILCEKDCNVM